MKIERQMGMIAYLMDHPKTTAAQLAELFQVSVRTIMRDIDDLSLLGLPICVNKGRNGGIFLLEMTDAKKPPLTQAEMTSLYTSLETSYQVLEDDRLFKAILKLNGEQVVSDFRIDLSLSKGNKELRQWVFKLLTGIQETKLVSFHYLNGKGESSSKRVEPYRVVFKDRSWYLEAFDLEKQDFRVYKIARMKAIKIGEKFEKREYQPHEYQGTHWINQGKIEAVLEVKETAIDRFLELLPHEKIQEVETGIYKVTYNIHDNKQGYNTLLGYGDAVKIISPQNLIENYLNYLEDIKKLY